jgi:hypothetical protein
LRPRQLHRPLPLLLRVPPRFAAFSSGKSCGLGSSSCPPVSGSLPSAVNPGPRSLPGLVLWSCPEHQESLSFFKKKEEALTPPSRRWLKCGRSSLPFYKHAPFFGFPFGDICNLHVPNNRYSFLQGIFMIPRSFSRSFSPLSHVAMLHLRS